MQIKIVTMWYNEEFLAPFFLSHYAYVDEIHIILDADTTDNSRQIALGFPNVTVEEFKFPNGMDDLLKKDKLTGVARKMESDWIYVLDADEFIFPPNFEDPRQFLSRQTANVIRAKMWQVYRHITDKPLDSRELPVVLQRRHGNPNRETGWEAAYNKPIIIKLPLDFRLDIGNHLIYGPNIRYGEESFDGAHWANADPEFVFTRRIRNRRDRQSPTNLKLRLTVHDHNTTEEQIRANLSKHDRDPILF